MSNVYKLASEFKEKYPLTVAFRIKKHCKVINSHLNAGEEVTYVFAAQKNDVFYDIITSCVVAFTNKRILIAQKRVIFGYFLISITPDMYNSLMVKMGIIWGKIYIDTIKDNIRLSNISRSALAEIETKFTDYMLELKQNYVLKNN